MQAFSPTPAASSEVSKTSQAKHNYALIRDVMAPSFKALDTYMQKSVVSDVELIQQVTYYIIHSGGKRLRPLLLMAFAQLLGGDQNRYITLATVIEYIHTATLLHDDVVDGSLLRRNQATANALFGNAPSVLVGDFLYSRAFQLLVGLKNFEFMAIMAQTTNAIAQGEVRQLMNIGNANLEENEYFKTIDAKTAILFAAACELAVVDVLPNDDLKRQAAHDYGYHLGCAFQVMDDYLDYSGDEAVIGKQVGDDLREGKMTLPLIYLAQMTENKDFIQETITHKKEKNIQKIMEFLQNPQHPAMQKTREKAKLFANQAKQNLAIFENLSASTQANHTLKLLYDLSDFAVERAY